MVSVPADSQVARLFLRRCRDRPPGRSRHRPQQPRVVLHRHQPGGGGGAGGPGPTCGRGVPAPASGSAWPTFVRAVIVVSRRGMRQAGLRKRLYAGNNADEIIDRIARTFTALVEYVNFSSLAHPIEPAVIGVTAVEPKRSGAADEYKEPAAKRHRLPPVGAGSLEYHVNIVLPEGRDQAVYDAIFKSFREHLG